MPKNRLYFVYEPDVYAGVMVAAESNRQAKMLGCGHICCSYIESRARLLKEGQTYYDDIDVKETGIEVIGKGHIFTALLGFLDWDSQFKPLLLSLGRGRLFTEDEDGNIQEDSNE